ncbi:Chitinase A1 precursor [Botrimarina hoheduenensis]|uniref:chitinase n=2 Tax=Botrimarina hoheduenensis TaxID=2528000 RepID=A0A5C5W7T7_9BACT|nr:Chitinase A1 precursor [Botrimarina hoheduenensis]
MVGYYATFGGLPVEEIPWKQLTHLCHAFLRLDATGKLVTTDAVPNASLTADGRAAGVPVLLTLGGGETVRGLEKLAAQPKGLEELAEQVVEVVLTGKYAGVDVDWEFPRNKETRNAHARLLIALREQLNAAAKREQRADRYLLTAAVAPAEDFGQWINTESVIRSVDWLQVMAYDMSGPWSQVAAHHAPLFPSPDDPERSWRSASAAMRYWETRGVPKQKLVMGVPMFGRAMPAATLHAPLDESQADKHGAPSFAQVSELAGKGWPAAWDNAARAPWLAKPLPERTPDQSPLTPVGEDQPDSMPLVISYDDLNSVDAKAKWAREQAYGGLSFWAIHQDRMPDGRHWLLEAANRAWSAVGE